MATIKPIERSAVHHIQAGQVIVDLCSVVKELVENSLDAGATSIEIAFKNHGLESIEVRDNGHGISPQDYETIALKHYTSKLSSYNDLTSLRTFGFRGEALSSLCALSTFHLVTARADEAPKGTRLDFESSGTLKGRQVVAAQRGTSVHVERLFQTLPVRRRELEKNIKREYGKVLVVLQAYACISLGVRFAVTHQVAKGKSAVFATKSNPTTRENIANVFGAKTLTALVPLDLKMQLEATRGVGQLRKNADESSRDVHLVGHISRPLHGEGRQTPDRQMFFVNARPCGLPQVAKAFNEVYKIYNAAQSPFIFADLKMDTGSYDVNVSPDKRTILLQDQTALLESLKVIRSQLGMDTSDAPVIQESLTSLFETQDQMIPQSQLQTQRPPTLRQLSIARPPIAPTASSDPQDSPAGDSEEDGEDGEDLTNREPEQSAQNSGVSLIQEFVEAGGARRRPTPSVQTKKDLRGKDEARISRQQREQTPVEVLESDEEAQVASSDEEMEQGEQGEQGEQRLAEGMFTEPGAPQASTSIPIITSSPVQAEPSVVQTAYDRMRARRVPRETATITIGSKTTTSTIGNTAGNRDDIGGAVSSGRSTRVPSKPVERRGFARGLQAFTAPGMQVHEESDSEDVSTRQATLTSYIKEEGEDNAEDEEVEDVGISPDAESDVEEKSAGSEAEEAEDSVRSDAEEAEEAEESDDEYVDETAKKAKEEARVQRLIQRAEEAAAKPSLKSASRADGLIRDRRSWKDSTYSIIQRMECSVASIEAQLCTLNEQVRRYEANRPLDEPEEGQPENSAEEKLTLTVSKEDFARMKVIGQFNLGFILATRPAASRQDSAARAGARAHHHHDEVFIIDQHASDEKYNFERLQSTTVMQNQRLVQPRMLELTAMEEEVMMAHRHILEQNGFIVDVPAPSHPSSSSARAGHRCRLLSLPMSREVVFGTRDLEELVALLADYSTRTTSPVTTSTTTGDDAPDLAQHNASVPRPSKTRRLFAMRACRSSIMIGRTLTPRQMEQVVRNLGTLDKPWNCPHGRPTMRHLVTLPEAEGEGEGEGGGEGEGQ
ncbi:MAG: hypothetical protein M1838_002527 [Thelocarpon superellum]|nr:MAG: hypothetical protein M1838_002527 [Thelocarpon superellum]